MGYLTAWKVLDEVIKDFRKRGITIPTNIVSDLRFVKTLIDVLKADPSSLEVRKRIEEYICNIEAYLISEGQERIGNKWVGEWIKRLDEAIKTPFDEEREEVNFIPGIPREQCWIRVKPSEELTVEILKALAVELNLTFNLQKDGYLLVYGKDECIKEFVKKIATKYGLKAEK